MKYIINWLKKHRYVNTENLKGYDNPYFISDDNIDVFKRVYIQGEKLVNISKEKGTSRNGLIYRLRPIYYQINQYTGLTHKQIKKNLLMFRYFPYMKEYCKKEIKNRKVIIYILTWKVREMVKKIGRPEFEKMKKFFSVKIFNHCDLIDDNLFLKIVNMGNISHWQISYLLGGKIGQYEDSKGTIHISYSLSGAIQQKLKKYNIKLNKNGFEKWRNDKTEEELEEHFRKLAKLSYMGPNKPEKFIDENTPDSLKYVGNWKRFIKFQKFTINPYNNKIRKRKNPDFIDERQRKVVEHFGEHCHSKEEARWLIREYALVGWDCLIIWYQEYLDNPQKMLNKIYKFIGLSERI